MGVKTALAGITLTGGDKTQGAGVGADLPGMLQVAQLKCVELTVMLTNIQAQMTLASDSSNATTIGTQLTALA